MKVPRKKYILDKQYQFGLIALLLLIVFVAVFISVVTTHYFLITSVVDRVEKTGFAPSGAELITSSLKPIVFIVPIVFIILVLVFIYLIFVSHRTAGPLYHLRRAMERVGKGDLSVHIQFRNNDEIHDVAESFNKMVEGLRARFGEKTK
jgi:methyl-accepting chemotaxis protein